MGGSVLLEYHSRVLWENRGDDCLVCGEPGAGLEGGGAEQAGPGEKAPVSSTSRAGHSGNA